MLTDFDNVPRFEYYKDAGIHCDEEGTLVDYEDYKDLLGAYKEIKWRMEQLEK